MSASWRSPQEEKHEGRHAYPVSLDDTRFAERFPLKTLTEFSIQAL